MEQPQTHPIKLQKRGKLFLHKLSGLWVFLVDNAFFGATLATAGLGLPISCLLAFFTGGAGVFFIQTLISRDSAKQAFNKALLAGVLSAIPTSIAGTVYGVWILRMAGLSRKDIPVEEPPIDVQANPSQDDNNTSH